MNLKKQLPFLFVLSMSFPSAAMFSACSAFLQGALLSLGFIESIKKAPQLSKHAPPSDLQDVPHNVQQFVSMRLVMRGINPGDITVKYSTRGTHEYHPSGIICLPKPAIPWNEYRPEMALFLNDLESALHLQKLPQQEEKNHTTKKQDVSQIINSQKAAIDHEIGHHYYRKRAAARRMATPLVVSSCLLLCRRLLTGAAISQSNEIGAFILNLACDATTAIGTHYISKIMNILLDRHEETLADDFIKNSPETLSAWKEFLQTHDQYRSHSQELEELCSRFTITRNRNLSGKITSFFFRHYRLLDLLLQLYSDPEHPHDRTRIKRIEDRIAKLQAS